MCLCGLVKTLSPGKSPTKSYSLVFCRKVLIQVNVPRLARTDQSSLKGKTHPAVLLHCYISSACDTVKCIPEVFCAKVSLMLPFPINLPHQHLLHFSISQNAFQQGERACCLRSQKGLWANKCVVAHTHDHFVNTGVCLQPGPCLKCQLPCGCIVFWSSEATVGGGKGISFSPMMDFSLYDCWMWYIQENVTFKWTC